MGYILDLLAKQGIDVSGVSQNTPSDGIQVIDGDTVVTPAGQHLRLGGINTEETAKFGKKISSGFTGGDEQRKLLADAIKVGGYTNPVFTGDKDVHQRNVGDLKDAQGRSLTQHMLNQGYAQPTEYTTADQQAQADMAALDRASRSTYNPTAGDKIADNLLSMMFPDGQVMAKLHTANAKQYGASLDPQGHSQYYSGPAYVGPDEDRTGFAKSNLKTGLKSGLTTMEQGFFDAMSAFGNLTGSEFIKGKAGGVADSLQADLTDLPFLRDGEAIDENGEWKLDTLSKLGNYFVATAASSAPNFVLSIGAGLLAPMTGGLSVAAPAIVYSGNTYRNQEVKSPSWAFTSGITQAVIEKLGITGVFTNVFEKKTQEQIIAKVMSTRNVSRIEAEQLLVQNMKKPMADIADVIRSAKGNIGTQAAVASFKGVLNEAPEESLQELAQHFGEQRSISLPDSQEDRTKLANRLINAGVGGAVLGGSLGGAHHVLANLPKAPAIESSDREFRAKLDTDINGYMSQLKVDSQESLDGLANMHEASLAAKGIPSRVSTWWHDKGVGSLFKSFGSTIMGSHNYTNKSLAALGTLLGTNRAFAGGSIDEQKLFTQLEVANKFGSLEELRSIFGGKKQDEISSIFHDPSVIAYLEELQNKKRSSLSTSVNDVLDKVDASQHLSAKMLPLKDQLSKYAVRIDDMLTAFNGKTGYDYTVDNLLRNKPIDKTNVARHQEEFIGLLRKHFSITHKEASDITDRLLNNDGNNDIIDSFDDILNFDSDFSKLKANVTGRINDPAVKDAFAKFVSHDLYRNVSSLSAKAGSVYVNTNLIGAQGSKLNGLLKEAVASGDISEEEAAFKAKEIRDWLSMRSGKYHPINNPYVKGALSLVNFLTTVTSLPLAAISSTVEFAQVYRNLNTKQSLKATKFLLEGFGGEFSHIMKVISGKPDTSKYREALHSSGFTHEGDITARTDIVAGVFSKWTEGFFKLTGLTSVTNITRFAKLSIAADAMDNWLKVYMKSPQSDAGINAYDNLNRIGVNVEMMLAPTTPEDMKMNELTKGAHNFVLEAVVQPSKINRPKFYNDPYLQLFTQFQGYTSTFTANVLPRLIKDIRKTGTTDQANAAAVIAMMFALSLLALYLKDMIKYGESPPKWLKDEKEFQRVISQTGIFGTGQRIWDAISPVVPNNPNQSNVALSAARAVADQAPALSFLGKINDALSAPEGSQIKKTARLLPIVGTSPQFAEYLQNELGVNNGNKQ